MKYKSINFVSFEIIHTFTHVNNTSYKLNNTPQYYMKQERVSIRLDANTSQEIKELCLTHNSSTSTVVRTLIKRSLNEIRDNTTVSPTPPTV